MYSSATGPCLLCQATNFVCCSFCHLQLICRLWAKACPTLRKRTTPWDALPPPPQQAKTSNSVFLARPSFRKKRPIALDFSTDRNTHTSTRCGHVVRLAYNIMTKRRQNHSCEQCRKSKKACDGYLINSDQAHLREAALCSDSKYFGPIRCPAPMG